MWEAEQPLFISLHPLSTSSYTFCVLLSHLLFSPRLISLSPPHHSHPLNKLKYQFHSFSVPSCLVFDSALMTLFLSSSFSTLPIPSLLFSPFSLRPTGAYTPQMTRCCWRSMKACSQPPFRPSSLGELPHFKRK